MKTAGVPEGTEGRPGEQNRPSRTVNILAKEQQELSEAETGVFPAKVWEQPDAHKGNNGS